MIKVIEGYESYIYIFIVVQRVLPTQRQWHPHLENKMNLYAERRVRILLRCFIPLVRSDKTDHCDSPFLSLTAITMHDTYLHTYIYMHARFHTNTRLVSTSHGRGSLHDTQRPTHETRHTETRENTRDPTSVVVSLSSSKLKPWAVACHCVNSA